MTSKIPLHDDKIAISGSQNQDFRTISKLLPRKSQMVVLDMGCGIGLYSAEIARRGTRVIGVDLLRENLKIARGNESSQYVSWICADMRHLPFKKESFGLLISVEVLTHIPVEEQHRALLEMVRVAQAEANIFLTMHNRSRLEFRAWLMGEKAREVYETNNLSVWPANEKSALALVARCGVSTLAHVRFLNYYSRFTTDLVRRHPLLSKVIMVVEDILAKIPLVRRLSITLLLQLQKGRRGD
jgi:SAM-dependent methyltransferase